MDINLNGLDLVELTLNHLSQRARRTLNWYFSDTNSGRVKELKGIDHEMVLSDLLADLMHFAHQNFNENFDFDDALVRARMHFEAELKGDGLAG